MSNEIIFKKCDSKLFFECKDKLNEDSVILSPKPNLEEFNEDSVDKYTTDVEVNDHLFGDDNNLEPDNNIENSAKSIPDIPNKLFSGTKNVLKIIGWINDKIGKPNTTVQSISEQIQPENTEDNFKGKILSNIKIDFKKFCYYPDRCAQC